MYLYGKYCFDDHNDDNNNNNKQGNHHNTDNNNNNRLLSLMQSDLWENKGIGPMSQIYVYNKRNKPMDQFNYWRNVWNKYSIRLLVLLRLLAFS